MRYAVKGCKFFVGGEIADKDTDFVASDFASQTWVEVNEWITMGDIGDEAANIASQIIGLGRDKNAKGTRNAGSMENLHNADFKNAGQLAMIAAEKTDFNYAFKLELNDKPNSDPDSTNTIVYFIGLVAGARMIGGGANVNRGLRTVVQVNSNLVFVYAVDGTTIP